MDYGHSELGVGPGIFHVLPPKAPTEPSVASAKASPKPAKFRAQEVAPVAPAATQEALVFWDDIHPSNSLLHTLTDGGV